MPAEVLIAVIGACAIFGGPVITSMVTARQLRRQKQEDYAREDAVARQAAEAAVLLQKAQAETIARTNEVARIAHEQGVLTEEALGRVAAQMQVVHRLVNSQFDAALQDQRRALIALIESSAEVIRLQNRLEIPTRPESIAALAANQARVGILSQRINERQVEADHEAGERDRRLAAHREDTARKAETADRNEETAVRLEDTAGQLEETAERFEEMGPS